MATLSASDITGHRVRQIREQREWTRKELAGRCAEAGFPDLTVTVLTNLETGRKGRQFTVDEVIALAWVLAIQPLSLLAPEGADVLQVVPGVEMDAPKALEWLLGDPCENCHGKPDAGFTCNACGRSGS